MPRLALNRSPIVFVAVVGLAGGIGCVDNTKVAFFEACTKNVKRFEKKSEVERICGKPDQIGRGGPFEIYVYIHPKTKQQWHLAFQDDVLREAWAPSAP